MDIRIILLLLLVLCLSYIYFVFNKLKWEKIILKRQMSLGTINIEESKSTYFKLGSITTVSIVCFTLIINPNILDNLSDKDNENTIYDAENFGTLDIQGEIPYEFSNFDELINSSKITDVVYGTIVDKQMTEKFTYMNVEVISSTSDLTTIKVFQENRKTLLEVGSNYIMILTYSEDLDYYGGVGDNQGFFKEVNGYFEPVIQNMFLDIPKENLAKDVFINEVFNIID